MNSDQAYYQAVKLAKKGHTDRSMTTPAGRMAFARTGSMALRTPSGEIKERFIRHYQEALAESEKKVDDFFSDLKSELAPDV